MRIKRNPPTPALNDMNQPSDNDGQPGRQTPGATKVSIDVQASRTNMAIIHFLFTVPKWSIGLFLFLASFTSPLPATKHAIQQPIQQLRALVHHEAQSYQDCIQQASTRKQRSLEQVAVDDRQVLEDIFNSNHQQILKGQEVANDCQMNTQKVRRSLIQWQTDNDNLPWADIVSNNSIDAASSSGICTIQKHNQTKRLLNEDFQQYEEQVSYALDSYVDDSQNSLQHVQSYAIARIDYDWKYFIQDRIQPALDYLAKHSAQIQTMAVTIDVDLPQLEAWFRDTLLHLEKALEQAKQQIDILEAKLEEFITSIDKFHVAYTDLYHRLELSVEFTADLLPPGVKLPNFLDLSTLNIAKFYLPDTPLSWPKLELDSQGIHNLLDDAARECMVVIMKMLETVRAKAGQQLRGFVQELSQALADILELKDYYPPQYQGSQSEITSFAEEFDFQLERGQEAREWTRNALSNLRLRASEVDLNATLFREPNVSATNLSYAEEGTNFEYLALLLPEFSIPEVLSMAIIWLSGNTWVVEIVIQAYRLWRLETVYARGAIPDLPEIDYGDGDEDMEFTHAKYVILSLILKGFLRPHLVVATLLCLPLCIIAIVFWFPHVHHSCVATSNGTFLARNMFSPLLINQANAEGNMQYLGAELACQQAQRRFCSEIGAEAHTRHQAEWSAFHSYQIQHNQSLQALELMRDCVGSSKLTNVMKDACCGLKGYNTSGCSSTRDFVCPIDNLARPPTAFLSFDTYLSEPSCKPNYFDWTLSDALYDCKNLVEICQHIPCAGVNKKLIHKKTVEADCKVELYVMKCCYFLLSFFFHAVAINVICTLLFQGLRQVKWRQLCPHGIKLKTQLQEDGTITKGYDIQDRADKVAKAVRAFELLGKLQLALGLVLLLAYVITTLILVIKN